MEAPKIKRRKTENQLALNTSYDVCVNCDYKKVCELLLDKVYHPEKYVPGVLHSIILNDNNNIVERKMFHESKGEIHEYIKWSINDNYCIFTFTLINDNYYEGDVNNEAWLESNDKVRIKYIMEWYYKDNNIKVIPFNGNGENIIKNAVLHMKEMCEK